MSGGNAFFSRDCAVVISLRSVIRSATSGRIRLGTRRKPLVDITTIPKTEFDKWIIYNTIIAIIITNELLIEDIVY